MSNQRIQYPHPSPSSYFPHSSPPPPPPHFAYVPNPNAVQFYPYPPSPMAGPTHPSHSHQPSSPRPNRGGYHPHNAAGPSYHAPYHYHYVPPPPQPLTSPVGHPASPYSTHPPSQKFSPHAQPPYSPHYHPQPNGSYPPAWQTQPLSPLPKQLSMLPPPQPQQVVTVQLSHPPPHTTPLPSEIAQLQQPPDLSSVSVSEAASASYTQSYSVADPQPSLSPQALQVSTLPSPPASDSPELPQEPVESLHISSAMPSTDFSSWVIWSRKGRPQDAPGIIISPRANPPDHVIQRALQLPSPPASPKIRPKVAAFVSETAVDTETSHETKESPSPDSEHAEVLSSSATETTSASSTAPDTPVPGSPLSTNTSVSLTAPSPASKLLETPESAPSNIEISLAASVYNAVAIAATTASPVQIAVTASAPIPAPARPAVKKSWASLLQQPADATASSSKSKLPTSSVVGFSIPAFAMSEPGSSSGIIPRPELLNLINHGPTGSAPPPKIRPRGLINTGNMCFANTILQVLVYCPPFNRMFVELGKHLTGPVVGSQKDGSKATPLVDSTIQFLKEFMPEPKIDLKAKGKEREDDDFYELDSFIPTYIYDVMKEKKRFASMIGGYQEDAEEFLGFFLDTLEDELLSIATSLSPPKSKVVEEQDEDSSVNGWLEVGKRNKSVVTRTVKSTESPITRMFGGKFRSTLKAPRQRESVTVEDWRALRLDISREEVNTVQDAIRQISHPQPVQISLPTQPGQAIEASQQTLIDSVPPILVLHLKRFQYDTKVGDVVKINKQVAYGPDLEITPDLLAPSRRSSQSIKYQLFGVLYHHGQSASGGHYTLDILHPNRDLNDRPRSAWIRFDDELVSDVRAEDVFGGQERDDRCAYLLFYRRIGSGIPTRTYAQV